ncbi:MAG: Uma2 family endonuclease [Nannocystaceae bacterium]
MHRGSHAAPGPFQASQIREGDPYELSNGHAIRCMTAGGRHGRAHSAGDRALATDPAVAGQVGVDVGITWGDEKNLRAPDLVVGVVQAEPGWQRVFPPLAVEYADGGQDEAELQQKIGELLAGGTRLVWVVRLVGILRVEEYGVDRPMRQFLVGESLTAPGILRNPVPVEALVDPAAADAVALRNLLQAHGYDGLEGVEAREREARSAGQREALITGLETVMRARGLIPTDAQAARVRGCTDPAQLERWLARAAVADAVTAILDA